jgi:hypothetical protein
MKKMVVLLAVVSLGLAGCTPAPSEKSGVDAALGSPTHSGTRESIGHSAVPATATSPTRLPASTSSRVAAESASAATSSSAVAAKAATVPAKNPVLAICDVYCGKFLGPAQALGCVTGCAAAMAPTLLNFQNFVHSVNRHLSLKAYPTVQSATGAVTVASAAYVACTAHPPAVGCQPVATGLVIKTEALGVILQQVAVKADPARKLRVLPASRPVSFSVRCTTGAVVATFASAAAAWEVKPATGRCGAYLEYGRQVTARQKLALATVHRRAGDLTALGVLTGLCASANSTYGAKVSGPGQVSAALAMITLCPQHPQIAQIEANIATASGQPDPAPLAKLSEFAFTGKHVVPSQMKPGRWKAMSLTGGDRIRNCYWSATDSTGKTLTRRFVAAEPTLTIKLPAKATTFTNSGCVFKWVKA